MRYRFSDLKRTTGGAGHAPFKADMLGYDNYYPFGMMPEDRRATALTGGIGRYGYNGKEMDNEFNDRNGAGDGTANSYDYGFRMYEPRLGKFLSEDPLTADYPWYTPYQYAGNMPIWAVDLDGLEPLPQNITSEEQNLSPNYGDEFRIKEHARVTPLSRRVCSVPAPDLASYPNQRISESAQGTNLGVALGMAVVSPLMLPNMLVPRDAVDVIASPAASAVLGPVGAAYGMLYYTFDAGSVVATTHLAQAGVNVYPQHFDGGYADPSDQLNAHVNLWLALDGSITGALSVGKYVPPVDPGLGNPFKNYTLSEIKAGFETHVANGKCVLKYENPATGAVSYQNIESGYSYNLDPGSVFRKGVESPHVDVNYPNPKPTNRPPKKKLGTGGGFEP